MRKFRWIILLCAAGAILTWSWTTFGPRPYFFVDQPLRAGGKETADPQETALNYFLSGSNPADAPKPESLKISSSRAADRAVVNVLVGGGEGGGDSTTVTYFRFTLEPKRDVWRVVRVQWAWQGRGRLGWTTRPTS